MARVFSNFNFCNFWLRTPPPPPLPFPSSLLLRPKSPSRTKTLNSPFAAAEMEPHREGRTKFMEFPFVAGPQKDLMVDLVSTLEDALQSQLLPCTLPLDVQHCQNDTGTAQSSLHIRSAHNSSLVDFILGSWLHCELPNGMALNITSLSVYLNSSTDAPNFLIELIKSTPTSLIFILDLPPRKDLVLHPDYLETFYESPKLITYSQMFEKLHNVHPFNPSSLYLRSVFSPIAVMGRIQTDEEGPEDLEEVIKSHVSPIAKEVLGIWLDRCAFGKREVGEEEKALLKKRDGISKRKTIEIDLRTNFPRLFGPEITDKIVGAIEEVYNKG